MARRKNARNDATSDLASPQTRTEEFLAKIGGLADTLPEGEYSRLERYLKYIAENGSGVSSFNGRTGAVMPASGDYDANMVGAPEAPSLAPEFSESDTYAVGDFVMKDGVLYICSTAHTTAAWDASHFTAVNAGTYLTMVAAANAVANDGGVSPAGWGYDGGKKSLPYINAETSGVDFTAQAELMLAKMSDVSVMQVIFTDRDDFNNGAIFVGTLYRVTSNVALIYGQSYNGDIVRRIKTSGTWNSWEYVNPPLVADVEYRTTERFMGKPVYVKMFDVGAWGQTVDSVVNVTYPANTDRIVEAHIYDSQGRLHDYDSYSISAVFAKTKGVIKTVYVDGYITDTTCSVLLKYTKT